MAFSSMWLKCSRCGGDRLWENRWESWGEMGCERREEGRDRYRYWSQSGYEGSFLYAILKWFCFALFSTWQLRSHLMIDCILKQQETILRIDYTREKLNEGEEVGSCCNNSNYCFHCCWRLNRNKVHGNWGTEWALMIL